MQEAKNLDCGEALRRLVARQPSVASDPQVARLLFEKHQEDADILAAAQQLLLIPNFTVAVAGCFRPLLLHLVDGLVQSLRHLWLNGSRNLSENTAIVLENSVPLVDSRKSTNWSISSHEYAVMTFSRLLELAPYTLSFVMQYFSFAPAPFERLLHSSGNLPADAPPLLDVVRACYRYLQLEPNSFRDLWDWSPFLDLLRWTGPDDLGGSLSQAGLDVRWCAVQVLSLVLRMSDVTTRALSSTVSQLTEEECFACLMRWEGFSHEIAVEKAGMFLTHSVIVEDEVMDNDEEMGSSRGNTLPLFDDFQSLVRWGVGEDLSFIEICGVQLPVRKGLNRKGSIGSLTRSFVLTSTVKENLESVVLALSQRQPILLEGPIGSGKSSLIQELANLTGNSDVIFIHLDDQMDSKMLLGNYVCTEVPGEFKWQPGALTQAVVQGMWVVFEDIDRAPFEILSALVPLLEDRKLYIAGRGEVIHAAENFCMFSTITRTKFGSAHRGSAGKDILANLWRKVIVDAPSDEELAVILEARFPVLSTMVSKLIRTLNMVREIASQSTFQADGLGAISVHIGRQFSTRDLIKWCKRVTILSSQHFEGPYLTTYVRERIYVEAVDCFAGSISSIGDRQLVMRAVAELWEIPLERVDFFWRMNKPSLQVSRSSFEVGRATLPMSTYQDKIPPTQVFARTGHTMRTLESITMCVQQKEPVLLVGETGTGKTSLVQYLARQMSMPLVVLNLSQQSDSVDLLGGYKPVEAQSICIPLFETFSNLFQERFPRKVMPATPIQEIFSRTCSLIGIKFVILNQKNAVLLEEIGRLAQKKKWDKLLKAFRDTVGTVAKLEDESGPTSNGPLSQDTSNEDVGDRSSKRKRRMSDRMLEDWRRFSAELHKAERQVESAKTAFAFSFMEGVLVKALKEGHWILLDEVNLAPSETLERLTGVLEGEKGSLCLTERGDVESIKWHPDFRIFACMNPATDVGKRDLPISLKNRFTEFYVDELTNKEDLHVLVYQYIESALPSPPVEDIVNFYLLARQEAEVRLLDGAYQKPQYSLRSLARALEYTKAAMPVYGFQRSLYDGICMSFLTLLDRPSALIMEQLILGAIFKQTGPAAAKLLKSLLKVPSQPSSRHVLFEQFWVESGDSEPSESARETCERYVLTTSIREHLKNLARAVFVRKNPVLLQGPTSSGKTSMIEYLATTTGHRFVRINNHEHTDLQEYLGSYVTDPTGKLVFQEGILVQAVRKGYWIVLDELNLAPSDVLEALNRLLDDNRELFVPELQVMVKPHPHFMLFATQNPPGLYGGRKILSRAFRNRFIELHVDDIPDDELQAILEKRCQIPGSYAIKMVEVMKDLQRHRQGSKVFAGKHGFITPRDLFRWAERHGNGYEELAWDGYMLLGERLRNPGEKVVVQAVLEKHMRVKIQPDQLHETSSSEKVKEIQELLSSPEYVSSFGKIVWTKSMKRLFNLVEHCVRHKEPVLLVGDTGCGKTTVCQLLALLLQQKLHIINCHQHSETADFLGGLRPVRDRDNITVKYMATIQRLSASRLLSDGGELSSRIEDSASTLNVIQHVLSQAKSRGSHSIAPAEISHREMQDIVEIEGIYNELLDLQRQHQSLFLWHDGPLVEAMRDGDFFLIDEISLADDSVLERLNSVLEPKRLLVLAEKGGPVVEEVIAHPKFRILATMNPGGDFGKRELSPALRNRFTEIWVPSINEIEDLQSIVADRFASPELLCLKDPLLEFWQWFQKHGEQGRLLSVRDLLSWVSFINITSSDIGQNNAFVHGALLVLLDGIGLGTGLSTAATQDLRSRCLEYLLQKLSEGERAAFYASSHLQDQTFKPKTIESGFVTSSADSREQDHSSFKERQFGIHPFYISKGKLESQNITFELAAPTTSSNALRILRAMQLSKPVLLEGSPGVGKTSLVSALALSSCHPLVRINLSEQTDVMDLFGSDMPVEGGKSGEFCWSDGVFLQALKSGHWVLLDELNLASQSVLEGLNACLDHRGEVFIPELGRVFKCPHSFRVFACQNPISQGGGRKGLPKSFLNRFTKVYVDTLQEDDFLFIARALHPSIPEPLLQLMVHFNSRLYEDTMVTRAYGHLGSPWEFNLRDILRWCELIEGVGECFSQKQSLGCFLDVVYLQRMRTKQDRQHVLRLYKEVFGNPAEIEIHPIVSVNPDSLEVGRAALQRKYGAQLQRDTFNQIQLLPGLGNCLETLMHCVKMGWMCNLVGPAASGKTSLVRLLAALTGNTLHEFALSSATDTTELLGCFEQHDPFRHWQHIVKRTGSSVESVCCYFLSDTVSTVPVDRMLELIKSLLSSWAAFLKCTSSRSKSSTWVIVNKDQESLDPLAVAMLLQTVELLEKTRSACSMGELDPKLQPSYLLEDLKIVKETIDQVRNLGRFEWIDGGLLKALERGEWVLLENANLCNPTVLDRLNSLLEPNGTILINERGLVNGEAMVVRPHANFQLFLTVDPSHGEVSRAMRNRGIEIFMMHPDWSDCESEERESLLSEGLNEDAHKLLVHAGVPCLSLTKAMFVAHKQIKSFTESLPGGLHVSMRELSHWISLLQQLLERGANLPWSLACSWVQTYVRHLDNVDAREGALNVFKSQVAGLDFLNARIWKDTCLYVPGGWPQPHKLGLYCLNSKEACVKRDAMYLEFLVAQLYASKTSQEWQSLVQAGADSEKRFFWLQSKRDTLTYFPAGLLEIFLSPAMVQLETSPTSISQLTIQEEETKLRYACFWMVERGSSSDIRLRLQWLHNCAMNMAGVSQAVADIASVLTKEIDHVLAKKLFLAWEQLEAVTGRNMLAKEVPYASHRVVFSLKSINENDEVEKDARNEVIVLAKKLLALRSSLLQWQLEDEVYISAFTKGVGSSMSAAFQSYLHHTNGALRKSSFSPQIPKTVLKYAYPFFNSMRNFENELLIATNFLLWESGVGEAFESLLEWHEALWKVLHLPSFFVEDFLFHWIQTKRWLMVIIKLVGDNCAGMKKAVGSLQGIIQAVDETFNLGENSRLKPLLWKHGGHPQLLNSEELNKKELEVLTLCECLWDTAVREEGRQSFCSDLELRRYVVEGLSMSMWLRQKCSSKNAGTQKASNSIPIREAQHECGEILKMLFQKLDTQNSVANEIDDDNITITQGMQGLVSKKFKLDSCKCTDEHQNEQLAIGSLTHLPAFRTIHLQLLPWLDHLSIALDNALVAKISAASIDYMAADLLQAFRQQGLDSKSVSCALEFSLTSSSRSPVDFVPLQHVLWIMDSVTARTPDVCVAPQNIIQEMWFRWHQAIWRKSSNQVKQLSHSWTMTEGPPRLFQAVQSVFLSTKFAERGPVKEYPAMLTQLRISSMHMWNLQKQRFPDSAVLNLCNTSVLFQQIILAHKKSFVAAAFVQIHRLLCALHKDILMAMQIDTDVDEGKLKKNQIFAELESLLRSSQHAVLVAILDTLVLPCASLLYLTPWRTLGGANTLLHQGRVWLLIGLMRLQLLLPVNGYDPVSKYAYKHGHASNQLNHINLNIEVRQRSEIATRGCGTSSEICALQSKAEELKKELSALSFKIVPRPQPPKFKDFCLDAQRFMELSAGPERLLVLWAKLKGEDESAKIDAGKIMQEAVAWQGNSENFIRRLSRDFPDYRDFVQPVQQAIYELKFGLSLSLAAHLQVQTLDKDVFKHDNTAVTDLICLLMEFPSRSSQSFLSDTGVPYEIRSVAAAELTNNATERAVLWAASMETSGTVPEEVLKMEMKVRVLQISLLKSGQEVLQSRSTTRKHLELLDSIFSSFSSLWSEVREYRVDQKRQKDELLKFSTSTHSMDVEATLDEEAFNIMFPDYKSDFDGFDDNMVTSAEEDDRRAQKANEEPLNKDIILVEKLWTRMEEALFRDVTHIHQSLFSPSNILGHVQQNFRKVSDEERLHSFTLSYNTGRQLLKVVGHCIPASVDEQLLSGHLMRSNLEYQNLTGGSQADTFTRKADMYTDAHPSEIALMLDPVGGFLSRIADLLKDWPEHPILQQLLHISNTLLSFPLDTLVMKGLTGVELLLAKAQLWEDNAAKHVSIADELSKLTRLVTRWRKLELEGWATLLEKTEMQHVLSAQKLWFSLFDLLHRPVEDNAERYFESTISSIEEFMQTATFGEYRTRLQFLQAFYGHFSVQSQVKAPLKGISIEVVERLSYILYNVFKYYSQFLPTLDEILVSEKGAIETELKEFVRLSKWDDRSYYTLTLSAEKSHRKLHKFVKKYNELLKRSVSELLGKQSLKMGAQNLSYLASTVVKEDHSQIEADLSSKTTPSLKSSKTNKGIDEESIKPLAAEEWKTRCGTKLVQLTKLSNDLSEAYPRGAYLDRLPALTSKMSDLLGAAVFSEASRNNRAKGTDYLEMFSNSIIVRASDLRNGEHKLAVKKRAMSDLLKRLSKIGLSRHKLSVPKAQRVPSSWLQLQPAEAGNFLLLHDGKEFMADKQGYTDMFVVEGSASLWSKASDYYYKNMALLQQLQRSALDFKEDLSLDDVEGTTKYTENLLYVQQSQRSKAHEFSSKLLLLGHLIQTLSSCGKSNTALPRQGLMRKWMWRQKLFFDSLQQVLAETLLLFKSSEGIQLCPANSMRVEAGGVKVLLQELLPGAEQCKSRLDSRLLLKGSSIVLDDKGVSWPLFFTHAMLEDLLTNFVFLNGTQKVFKAFFDVEKTNSTENLSGLVPLQQLLSKGYGMFEEFEMEKLHYSQEAHVVDLSDLTSHFTHLYEKIITESQLAVQKLSKQFGAGTLQPSLLEWEEKVTLRAYEDAILDQIVSLRLTSIHQAVMKILKLSATLIDNHSMGEDADFFMIMGRLLDCIHVPLEMIHAVGMRLLSDYISLHKSVTKLGYVLSNLFVSLYTEGFCNTKEEEGKEAANKFDDADGTGMGEGEGKKDVSEQIEDEEQLMGGTEKEEDVQKNEAGKKADKGIEMEQDFSGDMMDLSEDEPEEEDGNDEEEEEKLESKMGEGEDDSEVVDEKLWNNDDEKDQQPDAKEKYEKDSAVSGVKPEDLEMRGKEDETKEDDSVEGEKDKQNSLSKDDAKDQSELPQEPEGDGEEENDQDKKEKIFEERNGVQPSKEETLEVPENLDLDGGEDDEQEKEQEHQQEESTTAGDEKEANNATDDTDLPEDMNLDEDNPEDHDERSGVPDSNPRGPDTDDGAEEASPDMQVDNEPLNKEPDVEDKEGSQLDEASQFKKEIDGPAEDEDMEEPKEQGEDPSDPQEMDARRSGKYQEQTNVIAGTKGIASQLNNADDEVDKRGMMEAPQEERSTAGMEQSSLEAVDGTNRTSFPEPSASSSGDRQNSKRPDINPYRSLGDALKHWKERINVVDSTEAPSAIENSETQEEEPPSEGEEDKMEYEFVTKEEQGSAQALGSATKEQLAESNALEVVPDEKNKPDDLMKPDIDSPDPTSGELSDKIEQKQLSANSKNHRNMKPEAGDRTDVSGDEKVVRDIGLLGLQDLTELRSAADESIVSLPSQHNAGNLSSEPKLLESAAETWSEEEISRVRKELETGLKETAGNIEAARLIWQKYEHLTARLSQELAEQLRMILEPTLAARLQGDYRTGKRINMKKIIPYIASSFRKDKIWLRRTKANKRQYQVVLAIDDSRSMSESHCGHLAVEALITICRAMSQVEIGQMAVASFGQKGNVHLLHDFDQPFSSEAGINMVSRFSFSQDNTIADQPMVDLLQFLIRMLDMAANHTAVPSGNVNLQQLVLIIADGRFHEKESLRRCIREATSRRQLLALIVLDSPQQSILDMQSVSFANGAPSFSKYLDCFPFPYYIVLRDIESLPRTLADLMRQWFELTQQSSSGQ